MTARTFEREIANRGAIYTSVPVGCVAFSMSDHFHLPCSMLLLFLSISFTIGMLYIFPHIGYLFLANIHKHTADTPLTCTSPTQFESHRMVRQIWASPRHILVSLVIDHLQVILLHIPTRAGQKFAWVEDIEQQTTNEHQGGIKEVNKSLVALQVASSPLNIFRHSIDRPDHNQGTCGIENHYIACPWHPGVRHNMERSR